MPDQDFNITDPIIDRGIREPHAVSIIEGGQIIHYGLLGRAILRAMEAFREAGWKPGQVVGISMEGSVALQLVVSLALARAGIVQVWLPMADPLECREQRVRALGVNAVVTIR
jgi:acyl-coenzyme A synthetase/AMP-(fatty) acid ligase